jgi:hypothetical protein
LYRKVEEELVRVGRELKEEKENGEKETRTRKQLETALKVKQTSTLNMVLLHNGGFCNTCTPKRCLHISVHFKTNAL